MFTQRARAANGAKAYSNTSKCASGKIIQEIMSIHGYIVPYNSNITRTGLHLFHNQRRMRVQPPALPHNLNYIKIS